MRQSRRVFAIVLLAAGLAGVAGCRHVWHEMEAHWEEWEQDHSGEHEHGGVRPRLLLHRPSISAYRVQINGTCNVPIRSVQWSWGDGRTTHTPRFPGVHVYSRRGTFSVAVVVHTEHHGVLRASTTVHLGPRPALLRLNPPSVTGRRVTINGHCTVGLRSLKWKWGDGRDSATAGFPGVHMYLRRGTYHVSVQARTTDGRTIRTGTTVHIRFAPAPGPPPPVPPPPFPLPGP